MDSSGNPSRIHLLGNGRHEEFRAAEAITPGHLIAMNPSSKAIKHAVAGGPAEKIFALEDALQGNGISVAYAEDDLVAAVMAEPGDVVYAWLSGGEDATPNEILTSNGDGTLKVRTLSTETPVAVPMESVDASDSDDVDERIKVRIL